MLNSNFNEFPMLLRRGNVTRRIKMRASVLVCFLSQMIYNVQASVFHGEFEKLYKGIKNEWNKIKEIEEKLNGDIKESLILYNEYCKELSYSKEGLNEIDIKSNNLKSILNSVRVILTSLKTKYNEKFEEVSNVIGLENECRISSITLVEVIKTTCEMITAFERMLTLLVRMYKVSFYTVLNILFQKQNAWHCKSAMLEHDNLLNIINETNIYIQTIWNLCEDLNKKVDWNELGHKTTSIMAKLKGIKDSINPMCFGFIQKKANELNALSDETFMIEDERKEFTKSLQNPEKNNIGNKCLYDDYMNFKIFILKDNKNNLPLDKIHFLFKLEKLKLACQLNQIIENE